MKIEKFEKLDDKIFEIANKEISKIFYNYFRRDFEIMYDVFEDYHKLQFICLYVNEKYYHNQVKVDNFISKNLSIGITSIGKRSKTSFKLMINFITEENENNFFNAIIRKEKLKSILYKK